MQVPADGRARIEHLETNKGYRCRLCSNDDDDNIGGGAPFYADMHLGQARSVQDEELGGPELECLYGKIVHLPRIERQVSSRHSRKPKQYAVGAPLPALLWLFGSGL